MPKKKSSYTGETQPYMCANFDCREFGKEYDKPVGYKGDCPRCGWEMLDETEFDQWTSVDDTPTDTDGTALATIGRSKDTTTFSVPACLSGCPIAVGPKVHIPYDMYQSWVELAKAFDTEWIAYLQGKIEDGIYIIEKMTFPEQKANGVHVNTLDDVKVPDGTIAAVHSHVGMQVFFSSEDQEHFNHPIELVVNRAGELASNGVSVLKCGEIHRGPAQLFFVGKPDHAALIAELKSKMVQQVQPVAVKAAAASSSYFPIRHHGRKQ